MKFILDQQHLDGLWNVLDVYTITNQKKEHRMLNNSSEFINRNYWYN